MNWGQCVRVGIVGVCLAVGGVGAGCETLTGWMGTKEQKGGSLSDLRTQLYKGRSAVAEMQGALGNLAAAGRGVDHVPPAYHDVIKAEEKLRVVAADVRREAGAMRDEGQGYERRWESEVERAGSAAGKSSAAQRRAAVRANYERISASMGEARDAYLAYEKDLADVRQALANDQTREGVRSAQGVIDQAMEHGRVLLQRLDTVSKEVDQVYAGIGGGAE